MAEKIKILENKVNLVPRSLFDKAKGETWSNPICALDHLSGM